MMLGSGARAVLVRADPVSARPYAHAAEASEAAYNAPAAEKETDPQPTTAAGHGPAGNRWAALVKK